jgi:hypothetical protein
MKRGWSRPSKGQSPSRRQAVAAVIMDAAAKATVGNTAAPH